MKQFKIHSEYAPAGDQPKAIDEIISYFDSGNKRVVLKGATGTGKTFTVSNIIKEYNMPTLVLAHNKTLAFQLYNELKEFFPENNIEYFVSYYDYYQPEAYIPSTDTYIEKDSAVNDLIDRLRLKATTSLMTTNAVVIVSSVSCIYGLGSPEMYKKFTLLIEKGEDLDLKNMKSFLIDMQYERREFGYERGSFIIKGDLIEIFPAYEEFGIRISLWGEEVEDIKYFNPIDGKTILSLDSVPIYPAKHFMTDREGLGDVLKTIRSDMGKRVDKLRLENKLLEAQRLESRTKYDLEMIKEIGYCNGIENYSRYFDGRREGEPPSTLIDFFPDEFLMVIDESHVTLPQVRGMFAGDKSRKSTLVEHGFRLPAALDNRPLQFDEFNSKLDRVLYVSATPNEFEIKESNFSVVEQINRPTGIVDPLVEVRPVENQVDDLIGEIKKKIAVNEKIIVITLTKKMAEDLADYLYKLNIRANYLHSELKTEERSAIIEALKEDEFDVIIGVNLLREGIDLPIVGLVAILDADKEGFLRSETSLIQIIGRASRNQNGFVILYGDKISKAMEKAMAETSRRREIQLAFNKENNITPKSAKLKKYQPIREENREVDFATTPRKDYILQDNVNGEKEKSIEKLHQEMMECAKNLDVEKAAQIRDKIEQLKEKK